jgi:hypothetical protein
MTIRSLSTQDAERPIESLRALDWLNFFLAALLMGLGPFLASSLSERGWTPSNIGFLLTVSGFVGLLTQVPAGELIDMAKSKRALIGTGTAAVTLALLMFGLRSDRQSSLRLSYRARPEASLARQSPPSVWDLSGTTRSLNGSVAISVSPLSADSRLLGSWASSVMLRL